MIKLAGGYITPVGFWFNAATGERNQFWVAKSDHVKTEIKCYTRALAEYYIWAINERVESYKYRTGN
jgi:hypothetical protein